MDTVEVIERAIQVLEDAYERVHEAKEAGLSLRLHESFRGA